MGRVALGVYAEYGTSEFYAAHALTKQERTLDSLLQWLPNCTVQESTRPGIYRYWRVMGSGRLDLHV